MKRFDMLLITLAVANSFPLKNEENAALKTKVMFYHKNFVCFRWTIMFIALTKFYFHIWSNFQLSVRNNAGVSYFISTGPKKKAIDLFLAFYFMETWSSKVIKHCVDSDKGLTLETSPLET